MSYHEKVPIRPIKADGLKVQLEPFMTRVKHKGGAKHNALTYNQVAARKVLDVISPYLIEDNDVNLRKIFEIDPEIIDVDINLYQQVRRLALKLILLRMTNPPNGFAIPLVKYIYYNLTYGPPFADWLKKARQAMLIKTLAYRLILDNQEFISEIENNSFHISLTLKNYDYDSFLNEEHLIPFSQSADDLNWSLMPVEENFVALDVFHRQSTILLQNYKLEELVEPGIDEYRSWISDSITWYKDDRFSNSKLLRELAKTDELIPLIERSKTSQYTFHSKSVFVSPGNARYTWQCELETLFKVKRVSFLLRQILEKIPLSAMCSPYKAYRRRKVLRLHPDKLFFMIDFKKSGLTINRRLLVILGIVLNDLYPDKGFQELIDFEDVILKTEKLLQHPARGVGLGNCNEGMTLIQCVIGQILFTRGMDSLFFNDDGVIIGHSTLRRDFSSILGLIKDLGLIINLRKTLISKFNIFCEEYEVIHEDFSYRKLQQLTIPFADTFFSENISIAKALYSTLLDNVQGTGIDVKLIPALAAYWGFEFHKTEIMWPVEFGGWRHEGETNVNECLLFLFNWNCLTIGDPGFIPLLRKWSNYLMTYSDIQNFIHRKSNISYREFVSNPFKDMRFYLPQSKYALRLANFLSLQSNEEIISSWDNLYNIRGLKNAKPSIYKAKCEYFYRQRKAVWKKFQIANKISNLPVLGVCFPDLFKCLRYLHQYDVGGVSYAIPIQFILGRKRIKPDDYEVLGKVLIMRSNHSRHVDQFGVNLALESVYASRNIEGSDFISLRNQIRRERSKTLRCNSKRWISPCVHTSMPGWIHLFFGSETEMRIYYATVWGIEIYHVLSAFDIDEMYLKCSHVIERIFPGCEKEFWEMVTLSEKKGMSEKVRIFFKDITFKDPIALKEAIGEIMVFLKGLPRKIHPDDKERAEEDYFNEYITEDDALRLLGEYTADDLILDTFESIDGLDDPSIIRIDSEQIDQTYINDISHVEDEAPPDEFSGDDDFYFDEDNLSEQDIFDGED